MTDHPIIFSAPMIEALSDGRKTQTRRILKPQPDDGGFASVDMMPDGRVCPVVQKRHRYFGAMLANPSISVGDRLYVREAHYLTNKHAYRLSTGVEQSINPKDDYEACVYACGFDHSTVGLKKRPSIHMPRWASRFTLTVTDVRVQRIQEISEADAQAEGIERLRSRRGFYDPTKSKGVVRFGQYFDWATDAFEVLWNSLHGPDAWDVNPWVCAITFDVHRCNIDKLGDQK